MRVLIFHGYLLGGTGSNVYNARLAEALVAQGHEVHLLCQERHADELGFVDAVADWDAGALDLRVLRAPTRCTVYRPAIGAVLPVYVADVYEGIEARPFPLLDDAEVEAYLDANVAAVREVAARVRPDVALANHLVMGPAVLARALEHVPYAVKVHGSALEYIVKPHPRFLPWAREGLAPARAVLAGSTHTAESLWAALADPGLRARTRLGPPGVDVEAFRPRPRAQSIAQTRALAQGLAAHAPVVLSSGGSAFTRDPAAVGRALLELARDPDDRLVAFVGKLIVSKGIDLLLAAWPLVLIAEPRARLAVVGFGAYRDGLERLRAALAQGDLTIVRELAMAGRAEEAGPRAPLRHLIAFLDALDGAELERYLAAARALPERVLLTGRLEHDELAIVLGLCEAQVVPSTFPEAFGMVAAEAAACAVLPICAAHSGLAEVTRALADAVPAQAAEMLAFEVGPGAVTEIAARVVGWLTAPERVREEVRTALRATAVERWSWAGVARTVLAAAEGRLEGLPEP